MAKRQTYRIVIDVPNAKSKADAAEKAFTMLADGYEPDECEPVPETPETDPEPIGRLNKLESAIYRLESVLSTLRVSSDLRQFFLKSLKELYAVRNELHHLGVFDKIS